MKRTLAAVVVVGSLLVGSGGAAHAAPNWRPNEHAEGSCGVGPVFSRELREEDSRPGASEIRDYPTVGVCSGN
jgi:hypothetical protein